MIRFAARLFLLLTSAVLLTGPFLSPARADGPALSAVFGIAGRYRPGGWCLVTVTARNPGLDTISGQLQVLTESDSGRPAYGRPVRSNAASVIFARPVTISGGSSAPQVFQLYLRGIDPAQADLTIRLVDGHTRGDGRSLAEINTLSANTSTNFTGGPIAPNSRLLVGFGGDPGAFLFLNGLPWPAAPVAQNPMNAGMPATLQVSEAATASDLPDKAAGYDGVDSFLLRSDAPLDGLTEAQIGALKGWIIAGGHLVVCAGSDPTRFQSSFFDGLLPASVSSTGASGTLSLTPKPLPGVAVLPPASGRLVQTVTGPYGAGSVTLTTVDPATNNPAAHGLPTSVQPSGRAGLPPLWVSLLSSGRDHASSVLAMTAAREENYGAVYYGSSPLLLSQAVMRAPSLDAPATAVIGVFLLVYLIILVPVNYLVLRKLDRKEWAWATIPALVFLFAAGTFGVGYAAKGGSVFVNRASIIETSAGRSEAGVYAEIGLFSPHRSSYDIDLSGTNIMAAIPNPGDSYYGRSVGTEAQFAGPAQFVETPGGISVQNASVNMWAMRAFDAQSTLDLGGAITGSVSVKSGRLTGTLVNRTAHALTDCAVFYNGQWQKAGSLAAGATLTLPSRVPDSSPQAGLPLPVQPGEAQDISHRMRLALAEYFRSLRDNTPNYYGSAFVPAYAPAPGEALLVGWNSDPGLAGSALQIDGRSVTENDVNLVIVHVPMSAK